MKSKLFKILGVVAAVAMIAAAIVAPVAADVTAVTASVATTNNPTLPANQISAPGNYSIYATLTTQLLGGNTGTINLVDIGDQITITATMTASSTVYDKVTLAGTTLLAITPTLTNATDTAGVIQFTAVNGTAVFQATVRGTTGTYTINQGNPIITATADAATASTCVATGGAFTLPDVGSGVGGVASKATLTANAAGDVITLSAITGTVGVAFSNTADSLSGLVITFAAPGDIATLTALADNSGGNWARTTGTPVGAAGVTNGTDKPNWTANADTFTVTFPSTFTVGASVTASIQSGLGWVTFPAETPVNMGSAGLAGLMPTSNTTANTVTFTLPEGAFIGAGAQVLVNITAGVVNPAAAGNYTVTVATSKETNAVTSGAFAIVLPKATPVAGVASVYNNGGVLMTSSNSLYTAINYVQTNTLTGAVIKLTAGTYTDALGSFSSNVALTIQGTDASAANVIIQATAPWTLSGKTVVVDSVTIDTSKGGVLIINTPDKGAGTVSNSNISGAAAGLSNLTMSAVVTGTNTLNKDTFTVKTGIAIGATLNTFVKGGAVVTGCTFNVTGTGIGIWGQDDVTVSGSTFTGAAVTDNSTTDTGYGISMTGGTAFSITSSTFTGLAPALFVNGAIGSFSGNTVTNCGVASSNWDAILVNAAPGNVYIMNNKITGSLQYIATVNANDNMVFIMENQFATNAKNVNNVAALNKLNATHNFWGAGVTAPASTTTVDYSNPLGSAPTASNFVAGTAPLTLDATATAGVNITLANASTVLGAAALTGNPVVPTIASTNTVVKYFDVFGIGTTGTGNTVIDFYGATANSITANSQIFFFNTTFGTWQACSNQTVNTYGNYVEVTLNATSAPSVTQFTGLPFALVTVPTVLGSLTTAPTALYPANGAVNVPINNLSFTWPAVAGTGVTYQFALAQASANTSANEFAILDYSDNTATNAEPSQETLQYNTVYWWEVRAVTLNSSGAVSATGPWSVQMFTTAPQPVTTTSTGASVTNTSLVITTTVVNTTVVQTSTSIVIPPNSGSNSPAIPSYLLWAVIAVGAVLIIAVIVLIVRTRRIP
jgi:hypothetical protein